jgi:hypothetical protein
MSARPNFLVVAQHEAAHAVALDAMAGRFGRIEFREHLADDGTRSYCGALTELSGTLEALLVTAVAGAVSDVGPIGCVDWRVALRHLTTARCCAGDYADCLRLAKQLGAGRSVAATAIRTAVHLIGEHEALWSATWFGLLHLPWEYPGGDLRTKTLAYSRDTYGGIPGCPLAWDDFLSIRADVLVPGEVAA